MAGYFNIGESKIRPGAYFNVQSAGDGGFYGARDGVVAVLFKATMGPLGVVKELDASDGYAKTYGTEGTTDAIREAFYGGAQKVVACRIGTGGACASAELTAAAGKLKITAANPGTADYKVAVRSKLADSTKKEIVFYIDNTEVEKYAFTAGGDELAAAIAVVNASSKLFIASATGTNPAGVITNTSGTSLAGGTQPTVANAQYSAALEEVEKHYFNVIVVDTEDAAVHALVAAFLDRIFDAGQFGMAVLASAPSVALETRIQTGANFNSEKIVYVVNAKVDASGEELAGYQVAAGIGGLIARTPSNSTVTHVSISRYTELKELLTNSEMETAEESGCLVLSVNNSGQVWLDNGITTLLNPDSDHDSGWKKIRRTKARFELLYRANAVADDLVGQVDNDPNGRATIASNIQAVGNLMINEGKLNYVDVSESSALIPDGDYCGFDIDVIDRDSAEHIYLTYKFRFSTEVPEE